MITSNTSNANVGADSYTDLSSVNAIRTLGRADKNQALEKIAQQFESMMVRMMMKSMRSANAVLSEGNMLSSKAGDMYQDMYDDQLALSLSQGGGMGIAEVMVRQLRDRYGTSEEKTIDTDMTAYFENQIEAGQSLFNQAVKSGPNPDSVNNAAAVERSAVQQEVVNFDGTVTDFIEKLYPMAKEAAEKIGVDPEVLIAQSALETGWGKKISVHNNGVSSYNLFNIKADTRWDGEKLIINTVEFVGGVPVKENASFRSYASPQQSFDDYVNFLSQSSRYDRAAAARTSESFIRELGDAGYATDPAYADKILRIYNSKPLQQAVALVKQSTPGF
jgi:flagellar protein FlgJ